MSRIAVAVVGVGNCARALVEGIRHYSDGTDRTGLMNESIGGFVPSDIEVVAAFDVDKRKVGRDLAEALRAKPNCSRPLCADLPRVGVQVSMGRVLDSIAPHMAEAPEDRSFRVACLDQAGQSEVVTVLRRSGAEVLVNYLPVGSEKATGFYVECALEAGVALVNCIPVFVASNRAWCERFAERNLPLIGDDIKAQLGATIVHRTLVDLFRRRGVTLDRTYQLNTGGNTDFLNMLDASRLRSKKESKTQAVQSVAAQPLAPDNIHIGPSDYVAWQNDNKVCFLRLEGRIFAGSPVDIELRLSVEDSPNSAGAAIDAIRHAKLALQRGLGGVLEGPSAFLMKHPPVQMTDDEALRATWAFVSDHTVRAASERLSAPAPMPQALARNAKQGGTS